MKPWLLRGVLVAAAFVAAGCGRGNPRGPEGTVTPHGSVQLTRGAVVGVPLHGPTPLHAGDEVTVTNGSADVALPSGGSVSLRSGSTATFDGGPRLDTGDLLVSSGRRAVTVQESTGSVVVNGASRLRRDLALTVGSYAGQAQVSTAGRSLVVPAYRQTTVAAVGLLPDHPVPLVLDSSDGWDRQELGAAIDLSDALDQASQGFNGSVPDGIATNSVVLRHALVPLASVTAFNDQLIKSTTPPLSDGLSPGELLVGAGIAVSGRDGTFESRWAQVFAFREQGAAWGLVALDQKADSGLLLSLLGQGLNRAQLIFDTSVPPAPVSPFDGRVALIASPPAAPGPPTAPSAPSGAPGGAPHPSPSPVPPVTVPPNIPVISSLLPSSTTPTTNPVTSIVDPVTQLVGGNVPLNP
jgi:hypothetical protein